VEGVTEYDAFGNPIQDGGGPTATTTATAADAMPATTSPAPPPSPLAAPIPVIPTYGPSKTSMGERMVGFLIFLAFAAPLGIGGYVAYNAFHTAKDAVDAVHGVAIKPRVMPPGATSTAAPSAPAASMLHPTTLAKALRAARRDPGGRLVLLRVAPERADFQLARRGGGLDLVQLRADGGRSVVNTPGTPGGKTITFAKIDAHAPNRLIHAAARRLHRSPKAIDYVVLIDVLGGPRWSAYFRGGAAFQGDAHGYIVNRIQ
jgi:hypothetical protein